MHPIFLYQPQGGCLPGVSPKVENIVAGPLTQANNRAAVLADDVSKLLSRMEGVMSSLLGEGSPTEGGPLPAQPPGGELGLLLTQLDRLEYALGRLQSIANRLEQL